MYLRLLGPVAMDVRDNEMDELDSQPLHASASGGVGERVLDPSPGDSVLEASTGQSGGPQEEVLESSPSFSPLSGTVSGGAPSSGASSQLDDSAGDSSASLVLESRPLRSRIPVKVSSVGDVQPPLVSSEETALMVQHLKASLPKSTDDLASRQVGSSQRSRFTVPLPPRVSTCSGSGTARRPSSRSRSRSGDERPPPSPDSSRSSRRRASSPSPARRV